MVQIEPLVAIVIVNYNGSNDTCECVKSILRNSYKNYKIIVVDNASSDDQMKILSTNTYIKKYTHLIFSKENKGFSEGNNLGIKYARKIGAEFVLLINNDTIVTKNFIKPLLDCLNSHKDAAIVTGSIRCYGRPRNYWYAGGQFNHVFSSTNMTYYKSKLKMKEVEVNFISGCLMMIPMAYIERYGMLSPVFFLYSEDVEYCLRAINNGFKLFWIPNSLIYHKESSSVGKNSKLQQYYMVRNNMMIISKFSKSKNISGIRLILSCIKKIIIGKYQLKPVLEAFCDYRKGLTGMRCKLNF